MASNTLQPHFVLFPLPAQGHMIPMIDIARLLAQHEVTITILTTPLNAKRFKTVISRAIEAGLQIRVIELQLPCVEAGLPEGCENFDMLPSMDLALEFLTATNMLQPSVEQTLTELKPSPSCIISDLCCPWTTQVALKFNIPRLVFPGPCCFALLCLRILTIPEIIDRVTSDTEYFEVPGLPDRIELTKPQITGRIKPFSKGWMDFADQVRRAEAEEFGVVVNTFEDLEPAYVKEYSKVKGKRVWCIGPVSFCNQEKLDKAERGNQAAIDINYCLNWLDSWEPNSVMYVCLGSQSRLGTSQLIELGLGLEASNRPFIWVIREPSEKFRKWMKEKKFEERIEGKGLVIQGWAPQVLILSSSSIGGFLTHCGWNSTLEGISYGLPMITWPVFAEQFCNEKLIVNVLKIGVKSGVEVPVEIGNEEDMGVQVTRDEIKMAIEKLMDGGEEGEMRRIRAKELGEMARRAVDEGGSSNLSIKQLIEDVTREVKSLKSVIQNHD